MPVDDEKRIDQLRRQTLEYTEALMRDLLLLDEVTGRSNSLLFPPSLSLDQIFKL